MFTRTSGLLSVAVLMGASASASITSFEARDITPVSSLVARQSTFDPSVIPSQCQTQCSAVVSDINKCSTSTSTDPLCGCTSAVNTDMKTCFNCLVSLAPTAQADIQKSYDEYILGCNSAGANLPAGTVGNGSGSSASGSASASGSGASSASRTASGSSPTGTSGSSTGNSSGNSNTGSTGSTGSTGNSNSNGNSNSGSSGSSAPGAGNGALSARGNMVLVGGFVATFFVFFF
ncbi:hypothetical protein V5O48_005792 [Marasmius crinis-equi]|uniref:Uncharacterized protein n=1 Tax=Marasmius crinis-equi TaxID=585013 RepID=A0ABR3FLB1_9AGAR